MWNTVPLELHRSPLAPDEWFLGAKGVEEGPLDSPGHWVW